MGRKVVVKFYGILKEAVGKRSIVLEVDENTTVANFVSRLKEEIPDLARALEAIDERVIVLVNGRQAKLDDTVEGEVIILPPAAGGGQPMILTKIARPSDNVDINKLVEDLARSREDTGAVALFVGVVRGVNKGEKVKVLEYECFEEGAKKALQSIAWDIARRYSLSGIALIHYVGRREPTERTLIVAVSGEGRKDVFPALKEAVEMIKHEVPIWKKEVREKRTVYIVGDKEVDSDRLKAA